MAGNHIENVNNQRNQYFVPQNEQLINTPSASTVFNQRNTTAIHRGSLSSSSSLTSTPSVNSSRSCTATSDDIVPVPAATKKDASEEENMQALDLRINGSHNCIRTDSISYRQNSTHWVKGNLVEQNLSQAEAVSSKRHILSRPKEEDEMRVCYWCKLLIVEETKYKQFCKHSCFEAYRRYIFKKRAFCSKCFRRGDWDVNDWDNTKSIHELPDKVCRRCIMNRSGIICSLPQGQQVPLQVQPSRPEPQPISLSPAYHHPVAHHHIAAEPFLNQTPLQGEYNTTNLKMQSQEQRITSNPLNLLGYSAPSPCVMSRFPSHPQNPYRSQHRPLPPTTAATFPVKNPRMISQSSRALANSHNNDIYEQNQVLAAAKAMLSLHSTPVPFSSQSTQNCRISTQQRHLEGFNAKTSPLSYNIKSSGKRAYMRKSSGPYQRQSNNDQQMNYTTSTSSGYCAERMETKSSLSNQFLNGNNNEISAGFRKTTREDESVVVNIQIKDVDVTTCYRSIGTNTESCMCWCSKRSSKPNPS